MTAKGKKITMPPFLSKLHETLTAQLEQIEQEEETILYKAEKSIHVTKAAMEKLREYISQFKFETSAEEIHFFKEIKPRFYSKLIYYLKVFNIETRRPNGEQKAEEKFLRKEMQQLTHFFDNNLEFYQYYRTGSNYLDEKYFLRGTQDLYLTLDPHYFNTDPFFQYQSLCIAILEPGRVFILRSSFAYPSLLKAGYSHLKA